MRHSLHIQKINLEPCKINAKQRKHICIHPDESCGSKNRNKTFEISTEGKQSAYKAIIVKLPSEIQTTILTVTTQWNL